MAYVVDKKYQPSESPRLASSTFFIACKPVSTSPFIKAFVAIQKLKIYYFIELMMKLQTQKMLIGEELTKKKLQIFFGINIIIVIYFT